ncbi:MAG: flagellar hook-basal body complex protein [Lachnospiraceae bacterium]|nr:flagellar hook-basal body complex protein [Lachnospiraceae bacterium]
MMRSLYSGVSGLKVHQTKMDVIGHNISNVNTIGFKSGQVNFSDILYQTTANASGPNAEANTAGTNARQIGLGASVASISNTVTVSGGTQRTDNALDLMIEGDQLFIVNNGVQNYFTKAGAFTVDAAGVLCNNSGCKVMGWQVDPNDPTRCVPDTVSELKVRSPETSFVAPEATENVYFSGNIDYKDTQLQSETGKTSTISFYDKLGQSYMAILEMHPATDAGGAKSEDVYDLVISDILDANGTSIFVNEPADPSKPVGTGNGNDYTLKTGWGIDFGGQKDDQGNVSGGIAGTATPVDATEFAKTGKVKLNMATGVKLQFDKSSGKFVGVGGGNNKSVQLKITTDDDASSPFSTIDCDFSSMTMYASSGSSSFSCQRGSLDKGTGAGKPKGNMTGISVDTSGRIYGSYDNGDKKLLCQIAVARFANPAGLEAVGNSLFLDTMNSEKFDGRGEDIAMHGGKMTSGVLEMSNVDLSTEFTNIITTQRGFQANSRVITTSDTMLEELINLKR